MSIGRSSHARQSRPLGNSPSTSVPVLISRVKALQGLVARPAASCQAARLPGCCHRHRLDARLEAQVRVGRDRADAAATWLAVIAGARSNQ